MFGVNTRNLLAAVVCVTMFEATVRNGRLIAFIWHGLLSFA